MNIAELKNRFITRKNLNIGIILLVLYVLWWLFWPLCKTYINMKSHNIMTEDTYELNEVWHC